MSKMTAVTDTRKRSRDEESCDFMPISKRINNLTLTSQHFGENDSPTNADFLMSINNENLRSNHYVEHSYLNVNYHQSFVPGNSRSVAFNHQKTIEYDTNQEQQHQIYHHHHVANRQSIDNELNNNGMEVYRPELTPDANPFYYDKNKLLFDLHIERQRRHQPDL